jgi:hypothetical protein
MKCIIVEAVRSHEAFGSPSPRAQLEEPDPPLVGGNVLGGGGTTAVGGAVQSFPPSPQDEASSAKAPTAARSGTVGQFRRRIIRVLRTDPGVMKRVSIRRGAIGRK